MEDAGRQPDCGVCSSYGPDLDLLDGPTIPAFVQDGRK